MLMDILERQCKSKKDGETNFRILCVIERRGCSTENDWSPSVYCGYWNKR